MLNNKKNKHKNITNKVNGTPQSPSLNMISEGSDVKGTIKSKNDIRVAGRIDGEAVSEGKLIITSTGIVDGNVKSAEADIAGKIEGEIHVSNKLILRQSAIINGDIYTKALIVEEGAQMNGACKMGSGANGSESSASGSARSQFAKGLKLKEEKK